MFEKETNPNSRNLLHSTAHVKIANILRLTYWHQVKVYWKESMLACRHFLPSLNKRNTPKLKQVMHNNHTMASVTLLIQCFQFGVLSERKNCFWNKVKVYILFLFLNYSRVINFLCLKSFHSFNKLYFSYKSGIYNTIVFIRFVDRELVVISCVSSIAFKCFITCWNAGLLAPIFLIITEKYITLRWNIQYYT